MKKIIIKILVFFAIVIVGFVIFVLATWDKKYDIVMPDLHASADSAIIERGRYLVYGPGHCATCHIPMEKYAVVEAGEKLPLSGGWELSIPPGTFRAPNLTPDKETGIGLMSDGEIARALRHSIKRNGQILFPFMPFQEMTDEDVVAIISFLRSQPAVKNDMKSTEITFLGKMILALGGIKPEQPKNKPEKSIAIDTTIAYGKYIANTVANCVGCHTDRDLKTGKFTGVPLSGGFRMPPDPYSKGYGYITPNLTSDPETGRISSWSEEEFLARFKTGRVYPTSPMPWGAFSHMHDVELKAIYKYLKSIPPVNHRIEKSVFLPGENFPED